MDDVLFLKTLENSLSEFEVSRLSRQFGIDYYALSGTDKRDRIREFLGIIDRQTRMAGLAEAVVALRPDLAEMVAQAFTEDDQELAWLDQIAQGEIDPVESGVTWRWTADQQSSKPSLPTEKIEIMPTSAAIDQPAAPVEEARTRHFIRQPVSDSPDIAAHATDNPYTPGRMITTDAMFFGRATELANLKAHLDQDSNVVVVGPSLFGRSSLVHALARHVAGTVPPAFLPAYLDLKNPAMHTVEGVLDGAWQQWWQALRPGQIVRAGTLAEFATAVRKLHAAGFRPLLILDEFEQLAWRSPIFDNYFLDTWRELGQERLLRFVLTVQSPLPDLLAQTHAESRFYELFQQIDLGLLDWDASRELLSLPVERAGYSVPRGAVEHLLLQAGPHPFFLHIAGHYLFVSLANRSYSPSQISRWFTSAATPFWQEIWDSLSPLAQSHYPLTLKMTDNEPSPAAAESLMSNRQLRILARRGLLIEDEDGYRPLSEGFADFIRRVRSATEAAAMVVMNEPAA